MTTGELILVAGVAVVGFFIIRKAVTPTTTAPVNVPPPSSASSNFVNGLTRAAGNFGSVVGGSAFAAVGAGPLSRVGSAAGSSLAQTEVQGFRDAGSGLSSIAHGNIGTGAVQIGKGAVETAAAPIVSAYSGVKSFVGGLI